MSFGDTDVNNEVDHIEEYEDDVVLGLVDDTDLKSLSGDKIETDPDKETGTGAVVDPGPVAQVKESKMSIAKRIFGANFGQPGIARKDIIKLFIDQGGLTKAGAATYYQQLTKKAAE